MRNMFYFLIVIILFTHSYCLSQEIQKPNDTSLLSRHWGHKKDTVYVVELRTDKVTYLSLRPTVMLEAKCHNPCAVSQTVKLTFSIKQPLTGKVLAIAKRELIIKPKLLGVSRVKFNLKLPRMTGLLASVVLSNTDGKNLDKGLRPFDVTDDLRRNFRYAGACFFTTRVPSKMNPMFTPEDEAELVYQGFQNCANGFTREYRGHYTPWEERGDSWQMGIYGKKGPIVFDKLQQRLCNAMNARGILPEMWMSTRKHDSDYMDSRHPWIKRNKAGKADCYKAWKAWRMNMDPKLNHPLNAEEEKLMCSYSRGAVNWIDYLTEEYILATRRYGIRCFWADNYSTKYKKSYMPLIKKVNKALGYKVFIKSNHNDKLVKDGITDVYWVETAKLLKKRLDDQLKWIRRVMKQKRTKGSTVMWTNTHRGGPTIPYSKNRMSPDIINNDLKMTHMYRQYLFEAISMFPDMIYIQNTPRSWSDRYSYHQEVFKEHCKTWGFQTQYVHFFNSKDIIVVGNSSKIVSVDQLPITYDNELKAGKIHIRVAKRPGLNQTIIHVFNYIGTDVTNLIKRSRPTLQKKVKLNVKLNDLTKIPKVYVVSPDSKTYDEVIKPKVIINENVMTFNIPLDIYTLVVVQR